MSHIAVWSQIRQSLYYVNQTIVTKYIFIHTDSELITPLTTKQILMKYYIVYTYE